MSHRISLKLVDLLPYFMYYGGMYKRILDLSNIIDRKSLFLLGPRQTGKTTYLKNTFPKAYYIDLLKSSTFANLSRNSNYLSEIVEANKNKFNIFIIDEIQKFPQLLDEVHRLIELDKKIRFILTGSSARKLKRAGVNLLGGRASKVIFNPLTFTEGLENPKYDLLLRQNYGGIPSIISSNNPNEDLKDYIGLYLKEEIQAEGLTRSIENFSSFLNIAGLSQCEQLNFTSIGSDAQISPRTIIDYFKVLEDTLVGYLLPGFTKTKKRKAMTSAKFYLFDVGVGNYLGYRLNIDPNSPERGKSLEHYIFTEIKAYCDYHFLDVGLFYWRSTSQFEVDFVIELDPKTHIAIEVKLSKSPSLKDYKGLLALEEDAKLKRKILVCNAEEKRKTKEGIEIYPIAIFLKELWGKEIW